ncbi:hypothetical protein [Streptomyces sp. NPDC056242]|uniref:hypothetical protein n=1 Tax=Streptomyces sp. NPDC056242 TaxID=3345760 RepID=UPI0035DE0D52
MAARKPTAKQQDAPEQTAAPTEVDEVHERGGWDVGYRGDRVDPADDDTYTVTGVLKAAQSGDGDE